VIAVIDYDVGNIRSVENALMDIGLTYRVTREPSVIEKAKGILLPGVGAFGHAMDQLHYYRLIDTIRNSIAKGTPLLGICLGMQVLFDNSDENMGDASGFGFIEGCIAKIKVPNLKVPHMGWNQLVFTEKNTLQTRLPQAPYVYFVHSYYAIPDDFEQTVVAYAQYGSLKIPAIVQKGNVVGMQFHPEKSGAIGMQLLKNFKESIE